MKVLFITRKWPPAIGGMETYSLELTRELESKVELTVRALPGRADGDPPRTAALLGFAVTTSWKVLRQGGYDVVHGADMAIWPLALLARLRSPAAKVVLSAHGTDVSFAQRSGVRPAVYALYMRLGVRLLRRARVLANSRATGDRVQGLGYRSVATIPLGTRPLAQAAPPGAVGSFILFAGRLIRRKGCAWFATEVLPQLPPHISLVVAGTVWDEAERSALASDRITYLGGIDQGRLGVLMAGALCVVAPNIPSGKGHFEGFGLVAVEAATAGGVVIASRMDGYTDSVLDGVTGFLAEPLSVDDWVSRISEVASWTPEARRAFTEKAAAKARSYFTWERVARETLEVYRAKWR